MILYFTGTGNSKFVAQVLAKDLDDELISLNDILKKEEKWEFKSDKTFVIIAPIYAWRLPKTREKLELFLQNEDLEKCIETVEMKEVMPFEPLLYRDFMLCERHAINVARGITKHTMPDKYPMPQLYEKLFKRTFPGFIPKKPFYENPIYYKGNHLSFTGSNTVVKYPDYATLLDYELELGVIITKEIYNADEQEALGAIGAFCVFNDFSI